MKKYALYPGVGRVLPGFKLQYIEGKQLAACYKVPYSECLDTSNPAIKKVISMQGSAPIYLLNLLPREDGFYDLPSKTANKIIVKEGLHESVNKNG